MTRYILAGGRDWYIEEFGTRLIKEIKEQAGSRNILSCFFAEPQNVWEEKIAKWQPWFRRHFGSEAEIQFADQESFEAQLGRADIVYLHGGNELLLAEKLAGYDLPKLWEGKIVVGSSAGACYLANWYWGCDRQSVGKGSGIVPLNVIVHYGSNYHSDDPKGQIDWRRAEAELQSAIGSSEKITPLREGEFVIVEQ